MSTNVVNLDAMIPRQDFAVDGSPPRTNPLDRISMNHLAGDGNFFAVDLRKPDFQRETSHWSPDKVVDIIRSFLDADLIPAVILWRAGRYIFVIDGAHRLSALLAWVHDDYGDRKRSLDFAGGFITDDQRRIAERTRKLVESDVRPYAEYQAFKNNRDAAPARMQSRLSNLADNTLIAQWVSATDAESAQTSFFKINQQGTPIDPTERRLLKSRQSASAIASRAITHAGSGHKYWSNFDTGVQNEIEATSRAIYQALYDPPLGDNALTTLDLPVAGRGYNALPFIFDLVNQANSVDIADTTFRGDRNDVLPPDRDGSETVKFLREVRKRIARITGDTPRSLGIHPVVYFYTRSGTFQPAAFLATSIFFEELAKSDKKLVEFTQNRSRFEQYLVDHKEAISLLLHKYGSGHRSIPWIKSYFINILNYIMNGEYKNIHNLLSSNPDFAFLTAPRPSGVRPTSTKTRRSFNAGTKTAAFFDAALPNGTRCQLCGALVHRNSLQIDHVIPKRLDGGADSKNAQISHPYCNSIKDIMPSRHGEESGTS